MYHNGWSVYLLVTWLAKPCG